MIFKLLLIIKNNFFIRQIMNFMFIFLLFMISIKSCDNDLNKSESLKKFIFVYKNKSTEELVSSVRAFVLKNNICLEKEYSDFELFTVITSIKDRIKSEELDNQIKNLSRPPLFGCGGFLLGYAIHKFWSDSLWYLPLSFATVSGMLGYYCV